jgi:hypothetical protein
MHAEEEKEAKIYNAQLYLGTNKRMLNRRICFI